ncbi:MAG TPA: phospholipase D-like domain-containing protein [Gaiellaceae bacterium]|nr:phospholipase D-like domain-containing protein [Gaiellaceae bacterium]
MTKNPWAWAREGAHLTECWFGGQITAQICAHHRRRLRATGWEHALEALGGGWASAHTPPRGGNAIQLLIDGAQALPLVAEELRSARSHVHLTGWHFGPEFALVRDDRPLVLRDLLTELAERVDVRVLAWAGAPLPLFRPSRGDIRKIKDRFTAHTKIQFALDSHERPMHCHHEKTIVIDDRVAFVGGIDLTAEAGDRYDTNEHPSRAAIGWHDAAARIEGPAVADVANHFVMRWREVTGEQLARAEPTEAAGEIELQIARTIPEKIYKAIPRGEFSILESYVRAFRGAQRFIYIENQFLWSPEISAVLVEKLKHPPSPDFRLVAVLPTKPNNGAEDTRGVLGELIDADGDAGMVLACTLAARSGPNWDSIYVHAKIAVVDDEWITIGSANLNEHSLFNDTELNLVAHDPGLARDARLRLWSEHLELPVDRIDGEPCSVIDELWKPISKEQLERRTDGRPLTHRLVRLPHLSRRSSRLLGPVSGLLVDG